MKHKFSFLVVVLLGVILSIVRFNSLNNKQTNQVQVTTWDALGYYMYLPARYIYNDEVSLKWVPQIDSLYKVSGGEFYQASQQKNGQFVNKYLMGVSILQTPFFMVGHYAAALFKYPQDGFSLPYQLAIAWGCLFWVFLSLFVLRKILLNYFNEYVVATVLIVMVLATNMIQYVAIEGGQSHAWIFPLYVFQLYATIQWHKKPSLFWSLLIGVLIGLSCISRPTEAVMIMIPLFWSNDELPNFKTKWKFFKQNPSHVLLSVFGIFVAVLPQLLYWKRTTGHFVYDVGSKWDFLSPHFRVLFGWEKGWFVYTPITILFVVGFFFLKKYPFRKSVLIFCLLNIYIIISWHIWRYGGSYSCRALVQSYPVFIVALAAFLQWIYERKYLVFMLPVFGFFVYLNMFQIRQYNDGILHYDEMNRKYYNAIFLNENPTPLDMSLLDNDERAHIADAKIIYRHHEMKLLNEKDLITCDTFYFPKGTHVNWLRYNLKIKCNQGFWGSYIVAIIHKGCEITSKKIRLFNALAIEGEWNEYSFDVKLENTYSPFVELHVAGNNQFKGIVKDVSITTFSE